MNDKTRRRLGTLALCLGLVALHFIVLLTVVHWVGTDAELYYSEQLKAGVSPDACAAGLRVLDGQLADYLAGDAGALKSAPFNQREMTHMADCLYLFELLRNVRARLIPWTVVLILGGAWLLQDRRQARRCVLLSPVILLLPLTVFAVFAAADFDAAFTLFHKILFRNDLWLLNPATDLLIRICPASMFMHMGVKIALCALAAMAAVTALGVLLTYVWPKGKEENTWKTTTRRGPAPRQYDFGSRGKR